MSYTFARSETRPFMAQRYHAPVQMPAGLPGPLDIVKPMTGIVLGTSLRGLGEPMASTESAGVPWLGIGAIVAGAALGAAIGGHGASPEEKTSHEIIGGVVGGVLAIPVLLILTFAGIVGVLSVASAANQTANTTKP